MLQSEIYFNAICFKLLFRLHMVYPKISKKEKHPVSFSNGIMCSFVPDAWVEIDNFECFITRIVFIRVVLKTIPKTSQLFRSPLYHLI